MEPARRYCGFRNLVCAFVVFRGRKAGSKTKAKAWLFVCFLGGHTMASRADDTAVNSFVSKKSTSPAVKFTSRLVLPSAMTWTEKSACVAELATLTQTHTSALPSACCCDGVVAALWLVLVLLYYSCLYALSSLLITCNEKTREKKNVTKSKESKELRQGCFPQQLIFSSAITG